MLSAIRVEEIRRLLAEGKLSQRQIARLTGVSRSSVGLIASGRRRDRPLAEEVRLHRGPLGRCPDCGGLVHLPCLACQVRRKTVPRRGPSPGLPPSREEPASGLELFGEMRLRYEEIRARHRVPEEVVASESPVAGGST